jgi:hypothetical protein
MTIIRCDICRSELDPRKETRFYIGPEKLGPITENNYPSLEKLTGYEICGSCMDWIQQKIKARQEVNHTNTPVCPNSP